MFKFKVVLLLCLIVLSCGCSRSQKNLDENLICAVMNKRMDRVKVLLEKGADINVKNDLGESLLIIATWSNFDKDTRLGKFLIEKGVDINAVDKLGTTALMRAARYGDLELVRLYSEKRANVNIQDRTSRTALDMVYASLKDPMKGNDDPVVNNAIIELLKKHGAKTGKELKAEREAAEREESSI